MPAYYRSRIYIDLSDPSNYAENFDQLLRWIYDKPLYKKPEIGSVPAFLSEGYDSPSLATSSRFKRAIDAAKNDRAYSSAATAEYFSVLSSELEKLRLESDADPFDEAVVQSIESFLPYRNEAIELFLTLALYQDNEKTRTSIHRFFEGLLPYLDRPQHITSHREWDFDNFRFIIHELFLYALASLIKNERFESAAFLMRNEYYVPGRSEYGTDVMVPFEAFRDHMKSLESRNQRLELRRTSLRADLLEQRSKGTGIEFRYLMQADFILFLRDHLDRPESIFPWWPETLLYVGRQSSPFEVFARSRSSSYFERSKILLGIETKDMLQPLLNAFQKGERRLPEWRHTSFNPRQLLGFEQIALRP